MKNPFTHIQRSLSLSLSLWILFFAVLIFVVSLGFFYSRTRKFIRQDAIQRAEKVLNNTAYSVSEILNEVEVATTNTDWQVRRHLHPDSIQAYSRRILIRNPNIFGCSIAFEPYYFADKGQYYSIYSERNEDGTIETEQEGGDDYRYFGKDWYKTPLERKEACWVDPFYDYYLDTTSVRTAITSYSKPLIDSQGHYIGVISADLSLKWLSETISAKKPSPRSYCIILGKEGNYFVHPDTSKLIYQTIFTGASPEKDADRIWLGRDMVAGKTGMAQLHIDGEECYVFYRPLSRTNWSLAVVYPESEIFRGYNNLFYIVLGIIGVGLLLMLFLCRQIVKKAIVPVNQLARQAHDITAGHFDERMPQSERIDAVGQLQNSFASMQQSISAHVHDIQQMNEEIEQRNEELVVANQLAHEADLKKTAFMQDITHQVRTPLNIITGFAQVLREGYQLVTEEEMVTIIDAMQENSKNITGIIGMLMAASYFETHTTLDCNDEIRCNDLCRQLVSAIRVKNPDAVKLDVVTQVPDDFCIRSNREYLGKVLNELLSNSNKFTQQGFIEIGCSANDNGTVDFMVSDTGIGIPEDAREIIFMQFTKLDDFTEGIGLGLTLCKRVAFILGGDLNLDTEYTGGTTRFILTLPVGK
ncbi:MAG: histidine kinase [Bacteroidaceae bacterium]|nr:histidine kinase [Bacteroidaceae bacterium]